MKKEKIDEIINDLKSFFTITIICASVTMVCYLLTGQIVEITGDSMYPTLLDKEHVLTEKISPKFSDFKRGEIIVFKNPDTQNHLVIKRIVGMPHEKIRVVNGLVYINELLFQEKYIRSGTSTAPGEMLKENTDFEIPADTYFVMGDNRGRSIDSRYWGTITKSLIQGRALLIYKPVQNFRILW